MHLILLGPPAHHPFKYYIFGKHFLFNGSFFHQIFSSTFTKIAQ